MDEGKRDVRFVRSYWTSIGNPGIWATVLRDCRCYVLDVDVEERESLGEVIRTNIWDRVSLGMR